MNKDKSYFLINLEKIVALRRLLMQVQQRIDEILEEDCLPVKMNQSLFEDDPEDRMSRLKLDEIF